MHEFWDNDKKPKNNIYERSALLPQLGIGIVIGWGVPLVYDEGVIYVQAVGVIAAQLQLVAGGGGEHMVAVQRME